MNKAKTVIIAMIVALAMMTGIGAATTYDSSVELDNKDSSWQPINDGVSATIDYNLAGDGFEYHAYGTAVGNMQYSLIYYADQPDRFVNWGGDNPGALIGTIATDVDGNFDTGPMSVNLDMNLPCTPDANMKISEHDYCGAPDNYDRCTGAKLWMVPTAALPDPYPGDGEWAFWNTGGILFETDLITYDDCDLSITSPCQPANATIDVGDTFGGSVLVTIENATNVGSVDLTISFDPAIVTVTGVTDSDMENMGSNIGIGYVTILAYQSDDPGLNGDFTVANLTFTTSGDESCEFMISVTSFLDATSCVRAMPYVTGTGEYCACSNGDVNCDGTVNSGDVMYLAKHKIGITGFDTICDCASDVDGDGDVDLSDATYLAMYLIGAPGWEVLL